MFPESRSATVIYTEFFKGAEKLDVSLNYPGFWTAVPLHNCRILISLKINMTTARYGIKFPDRKPEQRSIQYDPIRDVKK